MAAKTENKVENIILDEYEGQKTNQFMVTIKRFCKHKLAVVGACIIIFMILVAVFAPWLAPYHYEEQHLADSLVGPCSQYPFGTDQYGRCILSRVIYGARTSLLVGFGSISVGAIFGSLIGVAAGYFGGKVDNLLMRCMDVLLAMPHTLLSISICAMLGPGLVNAVIAISVGRVASFSRIARASVITVRDMEYVEAVRAIGADNYRIILKHILPNIAAPMIVQISLALGSAILAGAGLSFIGLGVQPPIAEWGAMLSTGRSLIRFNWWLTTFPGIAIMLCVYGFNLMGDGLRDALDPRLKN